MVITEKTFDRDAAFKTVFGFDEKFLWDDRDDFYDEFNDVEYDGYDEFY